MKKGPLPATRQTPVFCDTRNAKAMQSKAQMTEGINEDFFPPHTIVRVCVRRVHKKKRAKGTEV